jgi:hypothetical protein
MNWKQHLDHHENCVSAYIGAREAVRKAFGLAFAECCNSLFQQYPDLDSFRWSQYARGVEVPPGPVELEIALYLGIFDADLAEAFGDGVSVTVHRDGRIDIGRL